jgi:transcriptional regulator with XRE-family HTH domain
VLKHRKTLGENLERAIRESSLSKTELAKRAGISRVTLDNYIKGEVSATVDNLISLCRNMNVSFMELTLGIDGQDVSSDLRVALALTRAAREEVRKPENISDEKPVSRRRR